MIRANITGSDRCQAEGIAVRGAAPVLAMCRKLLDAGYDPARPLHAYRGDALALKVRSIGEGAKLTVNESRAPRFIRWKPFPVVEGSPRIAPFPVPATSPARAMSDALVSPTADQLAA